MAHVRLFSGERMPLEMHKVRIVQKLNLPPVEYRHQAMTEAGNNTFLLQRPRRECAPNRRRIPTTQPLVR